MSIFGDKNFEHRARVLRVFKNKPPRNKRMFAYQDRRSGKVTTTVVDEEEFPEGIDCDVPKERSWSESSDDSYVIVM